jgi:dipeptidyl aminopeptidase/acylaminoacyl peptidase
MDDNSAASSLWLLSTLGGEPRPLTQCGSKDGAPQWSPRGDLIAFVAKREQQGSKDDETQLYVIAPDGGEARRAATVATGVEAFRWLPDGRRLAFVSWVWPGAEGRQGAGQGASRVQEAQGKRLRHQRDAVPLLGPQHCRWAASRSCTCWNWARRPARRACATCSRARPTACSAPTRRRTASTSRPTVGASPSPSTRRPRSASRTGRRWPSSTCAAARIDEIVRDADWHFTAPRYSPDGQRIAFVASTTGASTRCPRSWRCGSARPTPGTCQRRVGPRRHAPLQWEDDGQAVLFTAEQEGRKHLWRFDLQDRRAERLVAGGTVQAFDKRAGVVLTLADGIDHPARLSAHLPGQPARRIEHFNDALLARSELARTEEVWYRGRCQRPAQGRPGADVAELPARLRPEEEVPDPAPIHGGPHTAFGDAFHYRWNVQPWPPRAMWWPASTTTAPAASATPSSTASPTAGASWNCRTSKRATDWLLKKPWADPQRVFATGGSYGGFMVAWMNGHVPPGRYAAYVCHAGCFDWTAMFADDAFSWHAKELGAFYWDDMAQVQPAEPACLRRRDAARPRW